MGDFSEVLVHLATEKVEEIPQGLLMMRNKNVCGVTNWFLSLTGSCH